MKESDWFFPRTHSALPKTHGLKLKEQRIPKGRLGFVTRRKVEHGVWAIKNNQYIRKVQGGGAGAKGGGGGRGEK
jgi:hypothetical protein